ncbi:MAG: hypothetical protein IH583_07385, partial [Candidatus Aminicenantes bacterium]|nr:hypothetical protein [Candidatus Aminicenantes bacterium]
MSRSRSRRIMTILSTAGLLAAMTAAATAESLDKFVCSAGLAPAVSPVVTRGQFNGYTNFWQSVYWKWFQYGNLFLVSQTDVERSIAQNKIDIAEELGIPGLSLAEGFLEAWLKGPAAELEDPDAAALEKALD